MPSEYGYDGGGSVLGGILSAMNYHDTAVKNARDLQQQQAMVPFLNKMFPQMGGALPNAAAFEPYIKGLLGTSESGANNARAGELGAETNRINTLLPGQEEAQQNDNQFSRDTMGQRENNLAAQGNEMIANAGRTNAETQAQNINNETLPEENMGKILGQWNTNQETGARTNLYQNEAQEGPAKLGMELQKLKFDMDPSSPDNQYKAAEAGLSHARARNMDAETNMYSQGQPQQGGPDPRLAAFAAALAGHQTQTAAPGDLGGGMSLPGMPAPNRPITDLRQLLQHPDLRYLLQPQVQQQQQQQGAQ